MVKTLVPGWLRIHELELARRNFNAEVSGTGFFVIRPWRILMCAGKQIASHVSSNVH